MEIPEKGEDRAEFGELIGEELVDLFQELQEDLESNQPRFEQACDRLKNEIEFLVEYYIYTYFPKSFQFLSDLFPEAAERHAENVYQRILVEINEARRLIENQLAISISVGKFHTVNSLGRRMK